MYVNRQIGFPVIFFFSKFYLLKSLLLASAVYVGYEYFGLKFLEIPFIPIATIGTAVAFYVGFKNHASYERLWEARKIWGAITNISRSWAISVVSLVRDRKGDVGTCLRMIRRHLCWVNALRIQLRRGTTCSGDADSKLTHVKLVHIHQPPICYDTEMKTTLERFIEPGEREALEKCSNVASNVLKEQLKELTALKDDGVIDGFEHNSMQNLIYQCFDQQGAAERIKSFPFPRQYAHFSMLFVTIFNYLLPFGLIGELARAEHSLTWLMIPFTILISWIFLTMELVGDSSEDPFVTGLNDVPISAISINIERDLLEIMDEAELPAKLEPVNHILL